MEVYVIALIWKKKKLPPQYKGGIKTVLSIDFTEKRPIYDVFDDVDFKYAKAMKDFFIR